MSGMFAAKPDWGSAIQAGIGGYLAGRGMPGGAQILSQVHQRQMMAQQQAMEEAQYQQHRGDELSDYGEKLKLAAKYKPDAQPHFFESNSGDQYAIGPDGQPQLVFKDPLRYKLVPNGMGGVVPVSIEALMGGGQQQPEILQSLPPGAKPIGGPMPQASGGFPRPY